VDQEELTVPSAVAAMVDMGKDRIDYLCCKLLIGAIRIPLDRLGIGQ
jgi:hypothetical protein